MKGIISALFALFVSTWAWAATPVYINVASAEEIAEGLKGVGLSKAEAIVQYRNQNGPFGHIDELVNVKGIGLRTVDRNREVLDLSTGKRKSPKHSGDD